MASLKSKRSKTPKRRRKTSSGQGNGENTVDQGERARRSSIASAESARLDRILRASKEDKRRERNVELGVLLFVLIGLTLLLLYLFSPPVRRFFDGAVQPPSDSPPPSPSPSPGPGTTPPGPVPPPPADSPGSPPADDGEDESPFVRPCDWFILISSVVNMFVPMAIAWRWSLSLRSTLIVVVVTTLSTAVAGLIVGCWKCVLWVAGCGLAFGAVMYTKALNWGWLSRMAALFVVGIAALVSGYYTGCVACLVWLVIAVQVLFAIVMGIRRFFSLGVKGTVALGLIALAALIVFGAMVGCMVLPSVCAALMTLFGLLTVSSTGFLAYYGLWSRYSLASSLSLGLIGMQLAMSCGPSFGLPSLSIPGFGSGISFLSPSAPTFAADLTLLGVSLALGAGSALPVLKRAVTGEAPKTKGGEEERARELGPAVSDVVPAKGNSGATSDPFQHTKTQTTQARKKVTSTVADHLKRMGEDDLGARVARVQASGNRRELSDLLTSIVEGDEAQRIRTRVRTRAQAREDYIRNLEELADRAPDVFDAEIERLARAAEQATVQTRARTRARGRTRTGFRLRSVLGKRKKGGRAATARQERAGKQARDPARSEDAVEAVRQSTAELRQLVDTGTGTRGMFGRRRRRVRRRAMRRMVRIIDNAATTGVEGSTAPESTGVLMGTSDAGRPSEVLEESMARVRVAMATTVQTMAGAAVGLLEVEEQLDRAEADETSVPIPAEAARDLEEVALRTQEIEQRREQRERVARRAGLATAILVGVAAAAGAAGGVRRADITPMLRGEVVAEVMNAPGGLNPMDLQARVDQGQFVQGMGLDALAQIPEFQLLEGEGIPGINMGGLMGRVREIADITQAGFGRQLRRFGNLVRGEPVLRVELEEGVVEVGGMVEEARLVREPVAVPQEGFARAFQRRVLPYTPSPPNLLAIGAAFFISSRLARMHARGEFGEGAQGRERFAMALRMADNMRIRYLNGEVRQEVMDRFMTMVRTATLPAFLRRVEEEHPHRDEDVVAFGDGQEATDTLLEEAGAEESGAMEEFDVDYGEEEELQEQRERAELQRQRSSLTNYLVGATPRDDRTAGVNIRLLRQAEDAAYERFRREQREQAQLRLLERRAGTGMDARRVRQLVRSRIHAPQMLSAASEAVVTRERAARREARRFVRSARSAEDEVDRQLRAEAERARGVLRLALPIMRLRRSDDQDSDAGSVDTEMAGEDMLHQAVEAGRGGAGGYK